MTQAKLKKVLAAHSQWIKSDGAKGARADLRGADLHGADLRGTDLRGTDLRDTNLRDADLRGADLHGADLHGTDLRYADLRGTNIDFSAWPLWCGSLSPKIDKRIAAQLLYHALHAMQSCADDPDVAAVLSSRPCLELANQFHRVNGCGKIEPPKQKGSRKEAERKQKGSNNVNN